MKCAIGIIPGLLLPYSSFVGCFHLGCLFSTVSVNWRSWHVGAAECRRFGTQVVLKKALGQHLLKDENVLRKLVKEAKISISNILKLA